MGTHAPLVVAYTGEYQRWQLGKGHPTNPVRARLAVERIARWAAEAGVALETVVPEVDIDRAFREAARVHSADYLSALRKGRSAEWVGADLGLRDAACVMFTGTVDLAEEIVSRGFPAGVFFNPQGAKHHAHSDRSSGFCALNDLAWAAGRFTSLGRRILYVDWDAHHGDGVEALLRAEKEAVTASIHDGTIFPGTGRDGHDAERGAYNWALPAGSGDLELQEAVFEIVRLADELRPDVVLLACGADGLERDPLSTLRYSIPGIEKAAHLLGQWCGRAGVPVLVGGAGGYQPETETPEAWALTVQRLWAAINEEVRRRGPELSRRSVVRSGTTRQGGST